MNAGIIVPSGDGTYHLLREVPYMKTTWYGDAMAAGHIYAHRKNSMHSELIELDNQVHFFTSIKL